jgi:agmatine/peptidylarginine deiminase
VEREGKEADIKTVLRESFGDDDLRWRHVGVYNDDMDGKHVVLFDLVDLEKIDDSVDVEIDFVERQWAALVTRLQN